MNMDTFSDLIEKVIEQSGLALFVFSLQVQTFEAHEGQKRFLTIVDISIEKMEDFKRATGELKSKINSLILEEMDERAVRASEVKESSDIDATGRDEGFSSREAYTKFQLSGSRLNNEIFLSIDYLIKIVDGFLVRLQKVRGTLV